MTDYESSCRFCLKVCSEFAVNIFLDENGRSLAEEVNSCLLGIQVNDLPLWPKIACLDCVESLQEVIKFRKKLIRVHKYLSHELALRLIRTEKLKWMKKCQADVTESSHAKSANSVHPDVDEPSMKCLEKECDLVDSASQELVQEPMIEGNSSVVIETWLEEVELQPEEIELQPEQGSIILDQSFKESDVQLELGNSLDIVEFVDNAEVEDYLIEKVMPESEANVALPPKPSQVEEKRRRKKENPVPTPTVTYFSRVRFMSKTPLTDEEKRLEEVIMDMKLFDCRLCFVVTESLHGLNMHLKEVHRIERKRNSTKGYFICCHLRGPVGPHALYDHIRLHLDKDAFKCKECDFQTTASLYLKNHIAHYHTQTPPTHYCDVCGAGFHTNFHMLDHIRRHAPRTAQTCKYCNKEYVSERRLQVHVQTQHEKVVNCLCDICGRGFPKPSQLFSHINDHGGPHGGRRRKKPKTTIPTYSSLPYDESYFKRSK